MAEDDDRHAKDDPGRDFRPPEHDPAQISGDPWSREGDPRTREGDRWSREGDPGVGGMLADPLEPVLKPEHAKKVADGPPSPDPPPPEAHGDWAPNRRWLGIRRKMIRP